MRDAAGGAGRPGALPISIPGGACRPLSHQDGPQAPLQTVAGQQHAAAAAQAEQAHVCPRPLHAPAVAAAGVGLAQLHHLARLQLPGQGLGASPAGGEGLGAGPLDGLAQGLGLSPRRLSEVVAAGGVEHLPGRHHDEPLAAGVQPRPHRRLQVAPLGADARHQEGQVRAGATQEGHVLGGGGPHHQPHVARPVQVAGHLGHGQEEGAPVGQDEGLQVGGPRVGAAAPDEHPLVLIFQEGQERIAAAVGVDGHGVEPVYLEEGAGVEARHVGHVGPLGVGDDGHLGRDGRQGLLQQAHPPRPQGLEEGQVGLVAADQVYGGLDNGLQKGDDVTPLQQVRVGVEPDAQQAPVALLGGPQPLPKGHRASVLPCGG